MRATSGGRLPSRADEGNLGSFFRCRSGFCAEQSLKVLILGDNGSPLRQESIDGVYRNALATEEDVHQDDHERSSTLDPGSPSTAEPADPLDDLTRAFVRLSNLPTCPLDRLSRYEATLWRQACQILFTLQCLDRRKPWKRHRLG